MAESENFVDYSTIFQRLQRLQPPINLETQLETQKSRSTLW